MMEQASISFPARSYVLIHGLPLAVEILKIGPHPMVHAACRVLEQPLPTFPDFAFVAMIDTHSKMTAVPAGLRQAG